MLKVLPSHFPYHSEPYPHAVSQNKPFFPQAALARYFATVTRTPKGPKRKLTGSESLHRAYRKANLTEGHGILQGASGGLSHAEAPTRSVMGHSQFRLSIQTHERPGWVAYHQNLGSLLDQYRYCCTNQSCWAQGALYSALCLPPAGRRTYPALTVLQSHSLSSVMVAAVGGRAQTCLRAPAGNHDAGRGLLLQALGTRWTWTGNEKGKGRMTL